MHENCVNGQDDIMHACDIIKLTFKFTYFALFLISILEILTEALSDNVMQDTI